MGTDEAWQLWGERDPYYGVLTDSKFRSSVLTPEVKAEFFALGQYHVNYVLENCRRHFDAAFSPERILDFGCGVGRVIIPFASTALKVVGVDIAPSMLVEARRNCDERGIKNIELVLSDDHLSAARGSFDLVHSCIVFQHIEEHRGRTIFERLVGLIAKDGCGAIQVTFGWDNYASTFGRPAEQVVQRQTATFRVASWLRRFSAELKASDTTQLPHSDLPKTSSDPEMQINYYNLSELMFILQRSGVKRVISEITNHGGVQGAFLFFQREF